MAITRVKTWSDGEILTHTDLNAEFDNVLNNARDLVFPADGDVDLDGQKLVLDSDGDTSLQATADDQVDLTLAGGLDFRVTANKFDVLAGSEMKITGQLELQKGADIASATSLLVDIDGNYFDVTGTTTITSFASRGQGSIIVLHFDDIVTLTHQANQLDLPNLRNIVTAAGDEYIFMQYDATAKWRMIGESRSGGWQPVTVPTISSGEVQLGWTVSDPYDTILWDMYGVYNSSAAGNLFLEVSQSSTWQTTNYKYHTQLLSDASASYNASVASAGTSILIASDIGANATDAFCGQIIMGPWNDGSGYFQVRWHGGYTDSTPNNITVVGSGSRTDATAVRNVRLKMTGAGGLDNGTFRSYGLRRFSGGA